MAYDSDTSTKISIPSFELNPSSSFTGCPSFVSLFHFTVCTNVGNSMICVLNGEYTTQPVRTGISDAPRCLPARLISTPTCPASMRVTRRRKTPSKREHKDHTDDDGPKLYERVQMPRRRGLHLY